MPGFLRLCLPRLERAVPERGVTANELLDGTMEIARVAIRTSSILRGTISSAEEGFAGGAACNT